MKDNGSNDNNDHDNLERAYCHPSQHSFLTLTFTLNLTIKLLTPLTQLQLTASILHTSHSQGPKRSVTKMPGTKVTAHSPATLASL